MLEDRTPRGSSYLNMEVEAPRYFTPSGYLDLLQSCLATGPFDIQQSSTLVFSFCFRGRGGGGLGGGCLSPAAGLYLEVQGSSNQAPTVAVNHLSAPQVELARL